MGSEPTSVGREHRYVVTKKSWRSRVRVGLVLSAVAIGFVDCGNGTAPTRPTPPSNLEPAVRAGQETLQAPTTVSWDCLTNTGFGRSVGCPTPPPPAAGSARVGASAVPEAPINLSAAISGSTVTLSWTAPPSGSTSYILEAGSGPGRTDIVPAFNTGSSATTIVFTNVPAGTYFVRVRASNSTGVGAASAEVVVIVSGSGSCPPSPPVGLSSTVAGATVTLTWNPPGGSCPAASYIIEAGSAAGLSNLANFNTGSSGTSFTATGVASGTYFVRTRATNSSGTSAPSNEITIVVGGSCSYSLTPASQAAPSTGGSFTTSVTASCAWSASSDQSWLTITSGASGTGSDTIVYSVASNGSGAERTAHITLSGAGGSVQLTVTQGVTTTSCTSLQTTARTVPGNAATYSVVLTASCAWSASSDQSWLTITSGSSGTGTTTIVYAVAANTGPTRTGHIFVSGAGSSSVLTVEQLAPLVANFTVSSLTAAFRKLLSDSSPVQILPAGAADACPLVNNSNNPILSCRFDATASTPAGGISQYVWTYFFATNQRTETTTSPQLVPTAAGCGFFEKIDTGGNQFIGMRVDLQVRDALSGSLSAVRTNQNIRVFPAGNCGYGF
jgi:hypothetical protein